MEIKPLTTEDIPPVGDDVEIVDEAATDAPAAPVDAAAPAEITPENLPTNLPDGQKAASPGVVTTTANIEPPSVDEVSVPEPAPTMTHTENTPPPVKKGLESFEVNQLWNDDVRRMKEYLLSQPVVTFMVPLEIGEKEGAYETVTMNGYRLNIKKGEFMELPIDVAKILADSYKLTMQAGKEFEIDRMKGGKSVRDALTR